MTIEHFIIGGDGYVGRALLHEASSRNLYAVATSRRLTGPRNGTYYLDLLRPWVHQETGARELPACHCVYLVAALAKFKGGACDREAYVVNVDSPIAMAQHYAALGTFVVFISSECVEWPDNSAMARQKATVEAYLRTISAAIIRPCAIPRDDKARLERFASFVLDVGADRRAGVHRWGL